MNRWTEILTLNKISAFLKAAESLHLQNRRHSAQKPSVFISSLHRWLLSDSLRTLAKHKMKRCYCREYRRGRNSKSLSHFWGLSNPEFTLGADTYGSYRNTGRGHWLKTAHFLWSSLYLDTRISGMYCKHHRPHSTSAQLSGLMHAHTWMDLLC